MDDEGDGRKRREGSLESVGSSGYGGSRDRELRSSTGSSHSSNWSHIREVSHVSETDSSFNEEEYNRPLDISRELEDMAQARMQQFIEDQRRLAARVSGQLPPPRGIGVADVEEADIKSEEDVENGSLPDLNIGAVGSQLGTSSLPSGNEEQSGEEEQQEIPTSPNLEMELDRSQSEGAENSQRASEFEENECPGEEYNEHDPNYPPRTPLSVIDEEGSLGESMQNQEQMNNNQQDVATPRSRNLSFEVSGGDDPESDEDQEQQQQQQSPSSHNNSVSGIEQEEQSQPERMGKVSNSKSGTSKKKAKVSNEPPSATSTPKTTPRSPLQRTNKQSYPTESNPKRPRKVRQIPLSSCSSLSEISKVDPENSGISPQIKTERDENGSTSSGNSAPAHSRQSQPLESPIPQAGPSQVAAESEDSDHEEEDDDVVAPSPPQKSPLRSLKIKKGGRSIVTTPPRKNKKKTPEPLSTTSRASPKNKPGTSKPTAAKKKASAKSASPELTRYVGNDPFGNYHMMTAQQVAEIVKQEHPGRPPLDEKLLKKLTLKLNHKLEDFFDHHCEETRQPYGFIPAQLLVKGLVGQKLLRDKKDPMTEFVEKLKSSIPAEDFAKSEGVLHPHPRNANRDTNKYLFE